MRTRIARGARSPATVSIEVLEERSRLREQFRRRVGTLATLLQQLRKSQAVGGALTRYYVHDLAARHLQQATELLPHLRQVGDPQMALHESTLEHFRAQLRALDPAARS
jgi:hypothetical protein